ncbi:MAG: M48 family metallopeptidase [Limibacillus sp.]
MLRLDAAEGEAALTIPSGFSNREALAFLEKNRGWQAERLKRLPRRVADYLKAEAKSELVWRAREMAARLERKVTRVTVRDTRSRWGSCSHQGALSFSWRLILAPEEILDYLVAHEVAHLVEMNHAPAFWRQVARLQPDHKRARAWLKREGASLWRYG